MAGQLVFRILPGGTCELWRGSGEHVKDVAELSVASVLAAAAEDCERTGFAPSVLLVDQALVPALRRALCNTPTTASALPAGRAHNDAVLFSPSQPARRVELSAVQQLVERGYPVRILLRHDLAASPSSDADAEPAAVAAWLATMPGVLPVKGDVTNRESVDELLRGCSACLALHGARRSRKLSDLWSDPTTDPKHSKNVNYEGIRNLIEAAQASETCRRLVRITGKGETPWSIFSILINGLGSMAKAWNYEGEQLLRACKDIDYTIIRPGVMGRVDDVPADSLALADNGGDLKVSSIAHGAIASLCVECLDHPNAARTTH